MSSINVISIVSISFSVQTLIGIIFYIVIARTLPIVEVGAITLFLSLGGIFMVAFSLNLDSGFTHFISYSLGKTGKYLLPRFSFLLTALIMFVSLLIIACLSGLISLVFFHSKSYTSVIILMGGYVSESIGLNYMVSFLQGIQSFKLASYSNILYSSLSMGIPVVLAILQAPVEIISSGFVIGAGISFVFSLIFVIASKLPNMPIEKGFKTKFIAYVLPIFFGGLTTSLLSTIDRVILPALTNLTLSAIYTYSLTIATIVTALTLPFSFFLFPKISQSFALPNVARTKSYIEGSLQFFYYLALPASLGATILSRQLLEILVGGEYASHYLILQIMVFSYSLFSFRPILSSILLGNRKTKIYMYSGIGALGTNVTLSLTLIPLIGVYGALIATVSAWAVSTIPRMVAVGSLLNHSISLIPYIKIWANSLAMAGLVFLAANVFNSEYFSLFLPSILGMIFYFSISILNKPFSSDTRELMFSIAGNSRPLIRWVLKVLF